MKVSGKEKKIQKRTKWNLKAEKHKNQNLKKFIEGGQKQNKYDRRKNS